MTVGGDPAGLEPHRQELIAYCYRLLGSVWDAEDATQETALRAWSKRELFDHARGTYRAWLFGIATNVCLDHLRGSARRALPVDMSAPSLPGAGIGTPYAETLGLGPFPSGTLEDPASVAERRESVRLAFVAALQTLAPRQRAVLVLRDVLRFSAQEVASQLGMTVPAVNSALQRAKAALRTTQPRPAESYDPGDAVQVALLSAYVTAFERYDVASLVGLLARDVRMSMPPFPWWVRGRDAVGTCLAGSSGCRGSVLVATVANEVPAFGHYLPDESGAYHPHALVLLEVSRGRILEITSFLFPDRLFPLFGLPAVPSVAARR
jgi:RNA polymerase sigma-70 factor (ECF subfamily)